jgi:septal ring factor EnvC (AmiA/AmiB activator)
MSKNCSICRKEIPSAANYCMFCGAASSLESKNKQKNDRSQKVKGLNIEIEGLKEKIEKLNKQLSDEQENKNQLESKIKELEKDNNSLKALKDNQRGAAVELIKKGKWTEYIPIIVIAVLFVVIIILSLCFF